MKIYLILLLISFFTSISSFKWKDCGPKDAPMKWLGFKAPELMNVSQVMSFDAKLLINKEIPENSMTKMEMVRIFNLILFPLEVRVPCFESLRFGSCEYNFCDETTQKTSYACDFMRTKANISCSCPIQPQLIQGEDYRIKFDVSNLNDFTKILLPVS